jgi:endonuclease-3
MDKKEKAKKILKILNKIYPTTPIPLNIQNIINLKIL